MENKIKKGLFIFFLIVMFLPLIQQCFPFITSAPLNGVSLPAVNVAFSTRAWWDAAYQAGKIKYFNDNLGFRPDIIRFINQVDYSLFRKISNRRLVEGKDHNLFLNNFIDGYYGKDFIGYDKIHEKIKEIKALQDTFIQLGKLFVVIVSPGKAYVYPENFPENLKIAKTKINNYEALVNNMKSTGIHLIDFNDWFLKLKVTEKEPIWSTLGIHWSIYGSFLAGDSLVNYLEEHQHIKMPHATWNKIDHTTMHRYAEHDISGLANMIWPIATVQYSYPQVYYPADSGTVKPDILFIGDSFLFFWIESNFLDNITSNWELWYYFRLKMEKQHRDAASMDGYDWVNKLNKTDIIVLIYSADNSDEFGNGFIENAYQHYFPGK